ncbi:MAG: hypothetical protein V4687_01195 [Bacteroidota bacterium]
MDPFNIKIGYGAKEITLTILPTDEHYYKIIYNGGIIGAVKHDIDCWELVPEDDIIAGDLPFYRHDLNSGVPNVILNEATVDEIGDEIEHMLKNEEE